MAEGVGRAAPRPALMPLVIGVVGVGVVLTAAAAWSALTGDPPDPWRPLVAFLLISAGWRLQCSVRVGGDRVVFFWGDAALVLSVGLVSPVLLVAVTAPAVGLALGLLPGRQPPLKAAYNSATAVIASTAAVGALTAVGATPLRLDSVRDLLGLGLAAVVYVVLSDLTTSAVIAAHSGRRFWDVQGEGRLIQAVSLVGNLAGAAAIWTTVALDPRLAVVAALAVLGTQQGYLGLRRVQHERRRRHELALAVSRLTGADGADPHDVARDPAQGHEDGTGCEETIALRRAADLAVELFSADAVEIEVAVPGSDRTWLYRRQLRPVEKEESGFGDAVETRLEADATAPLGSERINIGELRLSFAGAVRSTGLDDREQGDLAAFAAAVPAALQAAHRHATERRLRAHAEHQARHDTLTGLANRRRLLDEVTRRLGIVGTDTRLTLLEVTGLRELARTVGHAAVDRLIVQVAERLTAATEDDELVARLDAGRFAVVGGATGSAAERLRLALAGPLLLSSGAVAVTTAVGTAAAQAPVDPAELLRRAEVALAAAHSSPSRTTAYEQTVDVESVPRMMLVTRLRSSLQAGALGMGYELARDLVNRAPTSLETVPVWEDRQLGSFDADDLLDLANADVAGLHVAYVDWLLTTVLEDCHGWSGRGASLPVAVRLPRRALLDPTLPTLPTLVARHLAAAAVPADRLIVCVDDAMAAAALLDITGVVSALADLGVQIAVDRLTVLEHVPQLPVSQLRLPAETTALVLSSPRAAALVEGTVATAARLGLQTTARGVDSEALANALRNMGCGAGQGGHIAAAMDAATAGRYVWAAGVTSEAMHPPADVVVLARRRQHRRMVP